MAVLSHYVTAGERSRPVHHAGGWRRRRKIHPGAPAGRCAVQHGVPVLRTREPGGAPGAEVLRECCWRPVEWSAPAETLLHFAARAEHIETTIRPALAAGTWVVCDGSTDSTMAYQGYGQGADRDTIAALTRMLGIVPDVTLVLDVAIGGDRAAMRRGAARTGTNGSMRCSTRACGKASATLPRAAPERCVLLPGDGSEAHVHAAIITELQARLSLPGVTALTCGSSIAAPPHKRITSSVVVQ